MNRKNSILLLVTTLWLASAFIIPLVKTAGISIFYAQTATNVALAANGGTASASSELSSPGIAIDDIRNWATTGAWKDSTADSFPDWLQVDFSGSKTINEIVVYGVRDDYTNTADPTVDTLSSVYTLTGFDVQYWTGSSWQTVPNGSITNNNKVVVKISFAAITTTKIRVVVSNAGASYSRIVELEAWSNGSNPTPTPTPTSTPTPNSTPTPTPTLTPTPAVSPTPTPGVRTNVALTSNGGIASASSELSSPGVAIDGVRNWATTGAWKDATPDSYPDWLQVDFSGSKTINEIDVFAVTDDYTNPADPTESTTFSLYGITHFDVQYWTGSAWQTVPNANITNNNKVITKITFTAITTTKIRVVVNAAQASYSRIVELEAWSGGMSTGTLLGSPESSTNGEPELAQSNPTSIVYNFSGYNHANYSSIAAQYATFYCNDNWLILKDRITDYRSYPNFISCLPYGFGVVTASFNQPVHNLYFRVVAGDLFVGNTPGSFKVNLHRTNQPILTLNFNTACPPYEACLVDLTGYTNVTRIEMHSVNDINGVGYDDFTFDLGGTPPPTPTPNRKPEGGMEIPNGDGKVLGWARDPDNLNLPVNVHFYMSDANGNNQKPIGGIWASEFRSDVGNHSFNWQIPDRALDGTPVRDGNPHRLFAYAMDLASGPHGQLTPINGIAFTLSPVVESVSFNAINNETINGELVNSTVDVPNTGQTNPGQRIFPDRRSPDPDDDNVNHRKVRVKATLSAPIQGVQVYFRNFDVDDPSAESAIDDNGNDGNDNREGRIIGQPYPPAAAGILSGSSSSCIATANGVKCPTNAEGVATAYFTVTKQPGDNFVVAASTDDSYLNSVAVNGTGLKDSANNPLPTTKSKRTELLTVWRKLYIEHDSMGEVTENVVTGYIIGKGVHVGSTPKWIQVYPSTGVNGLPEDAGGNSTIDILEPHAYKETIADDGTRLSYGGRMIVAGVQTLYVLDNESPFRGEQKILVQSLSGDVYIRPFAPFELYDDDDFNSDDGSLKVGDIGEDVTYHCQTYPCDITGSETFSRMRPSDNINENAYAAAYIVPDYSWAQARGLNDTNTEFNLFFPCDPYLTSVCDPFRVYMNRFRGSKVMERDDFWVSYLVVGYQWHVKSDADFRGAGSGEATPNNNYDPINIDVFSPNVGVPPGGLGAIIFIETIRDHSLKPAPPGIDIQPLPPSPTLLRTRSAPHEIGHQFGLGHGDTIPGGSGGIMGYTDQLYFVPSHINIMRWRVRSPGEGGRR